MGYKNPKELLNAAVRFPAAIEAQLPQGAPKISEMLTDATGRLPDLPNFVVEAPDLPEVPKLPEIGALRRGRGVREVRETRTLEPTAAVRSKQRFLY